MSQDEVLHITGTPHRITGSDGEFAPYHLDSCTGAGHWPLAKTGEVPALAPTAKNISFSAKHNV